MRIKRAVITAAAPDQRALPLQTVIDQDGRTTSVLGIIVAEAVRAGIEEIAVVVHPGDEHAYQAAAGEQERPLHFIPQQGARGYGRAVHCARRFTAGEPFLHMVGDHIFVSKIQTGCAEQLVDAASKQNASVSGVQSTREHLLPYFGAVGGRRAPGMARMYQVDRVIEKPTPTEAEQSLLIPGLRSAHYLCFFGMHVFTPAVMELLDEAVSGASADEPVELSRVLQQAAERERYLALEVEGRRYPLDVEYGLLTAQLALALNGRDRETVLTHLCELLAQHHRNGTES